MKNTIKTVAVITASVIGGITLGSAATWKLKKKEINDADQRSEKFLKIMHVLDQWLTSQQAGVDIVRYFRDNQYHSIAVYGMGCLGERLLTALRGTDIEVRYCIDKRAKELSGTGVVRSPEDELPEVDAVVVTAVYFFDEIEDRLSEKMDCPIISLEDIIKRI